MLQNRQITMQGWMRRSNRNYESRYKNNELRLT